MTAYRDNLFRCSATGTLSRSWRRRRWLAESCARIR